MRSSVSYILSSTANEPNMSHLDCEQFPHDHAALLVLIRQIGSQLKPVTYNKFFDRINRLNAVKVTDSAGHSRNIIVRYVKEYPIENNDWGDFQTHRRLLGLVSIGKYDSQQELNEICRVHESLKVKYNTTLYDSRCILLKPHEIESPEALAEGSSLGTSFESEAAKDSDSSPYDSSSCEKSSSEEEKKDECKKAHKNSAEAGNTGKIAKTGKETAENTKTSKETAENTKTCKQTAENAKTIDEREEARKQKVERLLEKLKEERTPDNKFTTPSNFKSRAFFYAETDPCTDLEQHLIEFINSLFWVIESKRLEKSREKLERVALLLAPFEKKDFVGLDLESRNNKKRCQGRVTKHLGDLCLQSGCLNESLNYYHNASEILRSVNDWLWLGASFEGLSAASALVLYPNIQRNTFMHRNCSLQESSPKKSPTSIANMESVSRREMPHLLTPEDIHKRYKEAVIHYSKYQNAGIVEMEASFKAARICVEQNNAIQAATFLQNVIFINLTLTEQEKIQRFETLSDLYTQIGFIRKAAFCQRLAASRYVSAQNLRPNWTQCYNLMLQSFPGHKLSLDPTDASMTKYSGWPSLQIHLLQELVVAAKRMGHPGLATRHMTFLLQTMWSHLSQNDRKEFCLQLQSLSAQCEGSPVPLVLENGIIIPPANLINIPLCKGFTLKNLQPHLQPRELKALKVADPGPFIFTPISFGSLDRKSNQPKNKLEFLWVENDLCEVTLKLLNPLPFELTVSNMRLLTSGIVFESIPETVVLPPETPTLLTLNGTPKEAGDLELQGYSTHTLGVKSNCKLRHMKHHQPHYCIQVIPSLPIMDVKTSMPQSATFSTFQNFENVIASASLNLFNGQTAECTITLTNNSQVPIEMLEVSIQSILEQSLQEQIFMWSDDELQKQLPLLPQQSATFTLHLFGAGSFVSNAFGGGGELSSGVFSSHAGSSIMSMSAGPSSLPSRINSPVHAMNGGSSSMYSKRNEMNSSSFRSTNSGQSSLTTAAAQRSAANLLAHHHNNNGSNAIVVEGQLQLKYSGGAGLVEGYCRTCSIFVSAEMLPSLQVTNWDVMAAETSSHFYLVLDVANLTAHEMDLQYTPSKRMLVEAQESCRIPVPMERCPLAKLGKLYMSQECGTDHSLDLDKICSDHISENLNLQWSLSALDVKGKAILKGITLTPNMLDIVRMSPLNWDVAVNGSSVKPQEALTCEAGDCLNLNIKVSNSLERSLGELVMTVQFYQDYQNGVCNYKLETRLTLTGPSKIFLPLLEPQESAEHNCNVLFFTPGQYKMDIQVCASAPDAIKQSAAVDLMGHTWRFIPSVEINVSC